MWYLLFLILTISSSILPLYTPTVNNSIPSTQVVNVSIVVPPKNLALLQKYVQEHHYVNTTELYNLFIPNNTINSIVKYLENNGIKPNVILNVISFQATAGEVEKLLNGEFVITTIQGKKVYYFISMGTAFPGIILSTNLTYLFLSKPSNIVNITQAVAYNEITPKDLYIAYNVTYLFDKGINGTGVNIGILDFEGDPYIYQQLMAFDAKYGLPNPPLFRVVPIGPYNPNDGIYSGWALEISLDVEYAHVMAPNAGIVLYVANPTVSIPEALAYIVQQDEVSVVSQSWGIPEIYFLLGLLPLSYLQSMIYEYWLGEVEGITFIAASGDGGGNGYNFYLSPFGSNIVPSSIPYVLSVGGTTLYISGNSSLQTAWSGESIFGASTGGYSSIFPAPPYQGVPGYRLTPDVVADANPYSGVPVLYYYNLTYLVGGTSLASPIVAGILALAVQVHGRLGFANPLIYSLKDTKALVPVTLGYNTPYTASDSLNPVTGLGYINAGYFVNLISKPTKSLSIVTYNSTYLPGQEIKIVGYLNGLTSQPPLLNAYVYNGSSVVSVVKLTYNGSAYVGNVSLSESGIYEIYSNYDGLYGFTYIIVGYQAIFLYPIVAIYPQQTSIPVLVMITYPNGTLVSSFNSTNLIVYTENQLNGELSKFNEVKLQNLPIINISLLGITIHYKSGILEGYVNISTEKWGGVYVLAVNNTIGIDEIVLGIYVLPVVIPNSFTEPTVVYSGENVTLYVFVESLGFPNVTVSFIKNGKQMYVTNVNSITYAGNNYYIVQTRVPILPSGYYMIKAEAVYDYGNYTVFGESYTQIYVSNASLVLKTKISSVVFENQTVTVKANIYYPNGTEVRYGIFSAIFVPEYLENNFDSLALPFSVQLYFVNNSWVGNFTIPSGSYNKSGYTIGQLAGKWNVYIVGASFDGIPIPFNSSLLYSSLNVIPLSSTVSFYVMPYNYVPSFKGNYAYHIYSNRAEIVNTTAFLVDSIINNLTAVNSTIYVYNTQIQHVYLVNSKILTLSNVSNEIVNTQIVNYTSTPPSHLVTQNSPSMSNLSSQLQNLGDIYIMELIISLIINGIVIAIYLKTERRNNKK